ncbi:hypothetical protein SAMN05660472_00344 [Natronincola ferrireducens]|uniref:Uncharacterized protein n=2 Tax=Natronincola ferrireducens TaxID=393762 RepID=A0A1G8XW33_9FIRM|nr:hypothetical protein SAMN05660472_00344 [Natronincola ferrireducens]
MAAIFEYSFIVGIFIRGIMSLALMIPFIYVKKRSRKHYKFLVTTFLVIYSFGFPIHLH